jgi:16S rRNA (guanine527-N7)-methyltransferase
VITAENIREDLEITGLNSYFPIESTDSLARFTRRMLELNENLNLTHFREDEEVLAFHIRDSAQVVPLLGKLFKNKAPGSWMDLGSGCGFPGAIVAAAFPQVDLTLMDATHKKTTALKTCVDAAGWSVKTLSGRAEDLGRDPMYRETFDGILARAVADLSVVLEYAVPLLKPGGHLVNWMTESQVQFVDKSNHALDELKSKIVQKSPYSLSEGIQDRYLVVVEKMGKTPSHYPRAAGIPSKKPL